MSRKSLLHRLFRIGTEEPEPALEVAGDAAALTASETIGDDEGATETRFERVTESTPTTATE
jgi:hypothetical protein